MRSLRVRTGVPFTVSPRRPSRPASSATSRSALGTSAAMPTSVTLGSVPSVHASVDLPRSFTASSSSRAIS